MGAPKPYFSQRLLKAIDSWQAGSIGKAKKAKSIISILRAEPVELYYTSCDDICYRRSVISAETINQLFFDFALPEETSSWTTLSNIACKFKGGPPDPPLPGVIFRHQPKQNEIVLNLERLMTHEQFWPSVEYWEDKGVKFTGGIRKWASTQHEVILSVNKVPHEEFYALGSNAAKSILCGNNSDITFIGNTQSTVEEISQEFADAGQPTRRWIFDDSALRAYKRWIERTLNRLGA